jgi:hypothetical protein
MVNNSTNINKASSHLPTVMVNNSTNINKTNNIDGIVDYHCWEVTVCFVDIGGIVDQHCWEAIVCFVDIGGFSKQ